MSTQPPGESGPGVPARGSDAAADATASLGCSSGGDNGTRLEPPISGHPAIPGFELVTTPPLPPFRAGGFGRVYRAKNADGVLLAIKVPRPEVQSEHAAQMWARECALSRAFPSHEHVVRFYPRETARWPDGRTTDALVMEWLEGARGLARYADEVGLDKPERVRLLLQAVEGVAWMHAHGTPHCDLKSDNMLVIERLGQPVVKVTDFGGTRVAQRLDPGGSAYTPSRAAPEVIAGDPAAITPRADVYSLCKECAELIGGASENRPIGTAEPWRPASTRESLGLPDQQLDDIVSRGTQLEPRDRYATAEELRRELAAYRPPALERATRWCERWLWPLAARADAARSPMRSRTRVPLALVCLAVLGTVLAFVGTNAWIASGFRPHMQPIVAAPAAMNRVLVVREKGPDGLAQVAKRLGIDEFDASNAVTKRFVWAAIVRRLATQRPDAIVLDIAFPQREVPAWNSAIIDAVAEATKAGAGVPVVVATMDFAPVHPEHRAESPMIAGLAAAGAQWGCMNLTDFRQSGNSLVIPHRPNEEPRLPLAVSAVAAALGRGTLHGAPLPVRVDAFEERLRFLGDGGKGTSVGLSSVVPGTEIRGVDAIAGVDAKDTVGIYPVSVPDDEVYAAIDRDVTDLVAPSGGWADVDVRGRVVLLAAHRADDVVAVQDRRVPGVWFHAAAVQALLSGIDAPRQSWWGVAPMALMVAVGMLVAMPAVAALSMLCGVPVPTRAGQWPRSARAPRSLVQRWRAMTLGLLACAIAAPCAVHFASEQWALAVEYGVGACAIAVFAGVTLGGAAVCFAAWMGCVRRAWCLDRAASLPQ